MIKSINIFLILISTVSTLLAQAPIILDESFEDWNNVVDIANSDGDDSSTAIKVISDAEYIYIYFETLEEISIQNDPQIKLYIDVDNDFNTGEESNGIGAELIIDFGNRSVFTEFGSTLEVGFTNINLHLMPTVWSNQFELAIRRDASVDGFDLFSEDEIRLVVVDEDNDVISPVSGEGALYGFETEEFDELPSYNFEKSDESLIRVVSHNVLRDKMFEPESFEHYERVYRLLDPQIIGFQEIYNHTAEETADLVEQLLPSEDGEQWYAAQESDNILVSRFPILEYGSIYSTNNGRFLLNLEGYSSQMFVINAHTPCCTNHDGRQYEIDAMMSYLRDEREDLAEYTPIIIMGDMNLVGDPQNIRTLVDGNIQDEDRWGPDFKPDWDGTNLVDATPLVADEPMTFTHWSGYGSGQYSTGRLDGMYYSSSRLESVNSFVLYTPSLSEEQLNAYGLEADDSWESSDHLPLVSDFSLKEFSYENTNASIEEIRKNDEIGMPELIGSIVTISGVITASNEFGENGPAFIQNSDQFGMAISDSPLIAQLDSKDSVTIRGEVGFFNGLTHLVNFAASEVTIHEKDNNSISPINVTIEDILNQTWNDTERYEGMLVELNEVSISETGTFEGGNYILHQGQQEMTLRVDFDTNIIDAEIPVDTFSIVGVVNQFDNESPYDDGYQILPRFIEDFVVSTVTSSPKLSAAISIYPVPGQNSINIDSEYKIVRLTVFDQSGRVHILDYPTNFSSELDISSLKRGLYGISLILDNGDVYTQKLLIE